MDEGLAGAGMFWLYYVLVIYYAGMLLNEEAWRV
jgi:hypothetical protein